MARTTEDLVKGVLMSDYGPKRDGSLPSLVPFIRAANLLTNRVVVCATAKGLSLGAADLTELETWLAAHFYSVSDRPYESTTTDRAGAKYQGKTAMFLESSHYGQTALVIDPSGICLTQINTRKAATAVWLGIKPDRATAYEDR